MRLRRPEDPRTSWRALSPTPSAAAISRTISRFAFPPSGGAVTRMRKASPWSPVSPARDAPGTAHTRTTQPSATAEIGFASARTRDSRHPPDVAREIAEASHEDVLDDGDPEEDDDRGEVEPADH